jgi:hypothetical protein
VCVLAAEATHIGRIGVLHDVVLHDCAVALWVGLVFGDRGGGGVAALNAGLGGGGEGLGDEVVV